MLFIDIPAREFNYFNVIHQPNPHPFGRLPTTPFPLVQLALYLLNNQSIDFFAQMKMINKKKPERE